jgi:hypothetical protein
MRADSHSRPQPWLDVVPPALALGAAAVGEASLLEGESLWTRWLLFVPVAAATLPFAFAVGRGRQRARVVGAVLLVCWCLVAIASVGVLYLPSAIAMIVTAVRGRRA